MSKNILVRPRWITALSTGIILGATLVTAIVWLAR